MPTRSLSSLVRLRSTFFFAAAAVASAQGCGNSAPSDDSTGAIETGGGGGDLGAAGGSAGSGLSSGGGAGSSATGAGGASVGHAGSTGVAGSNGGAGSMGAGGGGGGGNVMGMCPAAGATAAAPALQIINWNGHKGAVSFTIDDSYDSALNVVVPALDKRKIPGTFYVICGRGNTTSRAAEWKKAIATGHEVTNHTMTHAAANGTNLNEIVDCDAQITSEFVKPATTFAYPLSAIGEPYKSYTAMHYLAGRGGSWGTTPLVKATDKKDWTNLPADYTGPEGGGTHAKAAIVTGINSAVTADSWYVITTHSILPENNYAGIPQADYEAELDAAVASGAWIATFSQAAAYVRGQQALLGAAPMTMADGSMKWTWIAAPGTPDDATLRVVVAGGSLTQGGIKLACTTDGGYFPVKVKAGELTWTK